jgi:hypothetical protein
MNVIKLPKALLFCFTFLFALLWQPHNTMLQARFAPPIEPKQTTVVEKAQDLYKKFTAPRPQATKQKPLRPESKRLLGILLLIYAGLTALSGLFLALIIGALATWGGPSSIFFTVFAIGTLITILYVLPLIFYAVALIKNSRMPVSSDKRINWIHLRREYTWGMISAVLYFILFLIPLFSAQIYFVIFPLLALFAIIRLAISIHRDRPRKDDTTDYDSY